MKVTRPQLNLQISTVMAENNVLCTKVNRLVVLEIYKQNETTLPLVYSSQTRLNSKTRNCKKLATFAENRL